MRQFIASAQRHVKKDGRAQHPRIFVFLVLGGVLAYPAGKGFNPRLAKGFFFPAMRFIFPNPRPIEDTLGDGRNGAPLSRQLLEKASIPLFLNSILGGPFAVGDFRKKMQLLSPPDPKQASMVSFDQAIAASLDLWVFADSLRKLRVLHAISVLARFFKEHRFKLSSSAAPAVNQDAETKPATITAEAPMVVVGKLKAALDLDSKINPRATE